MTAFPLISERRIGGKLVPTVSGRELHAALRLATPFTMWIARRLSVLFLDEGVDFWRCFLDRPSRPGSNGTVRVRPGPLQEELILTLEAAKHLALAERNEVGQAIRSYFIACEERFRVVAPSEADAMSRKLEEDLAAATAEIAGLRTAHAQEIERLRADASGGGIGASLIEDLVREVLALSAENRRYQAAEVDGLRSELDAARERGRARQARPGDPSRAGAAAQDGPGGRGRDGAAGRSLSAVLATPVGPI